MMCCVMLCYVMLCYAILCYAMLYKSLLKVINNKCTCSSKSRVPATIDYVISPNRMQFPV